jgi:hypothetical protein
MINILIEVDKDKQIVHDFCWYANQSIKFNEWYRNTKIFNVMYITIDNLIDKLLEDYIPIGSIEFVHKYMNLYNIKIPLPLNIPTELNKEKYLKRNIFIGYKKDINKYPIFIKPNKDLKLFTGSEISSKNTLDLLLTEVKEDTELLISDVINIQSEYRCIIKQNKLMNLKHYLGDFKIFPNIDVIETMITDYKNAPIAYTLDVGITDKNETILIECHNFYSVGLYGFYDDKLVYMFIDAFNQFKNK